MGRQGKFSKWVDKALNMWTAYTGAEGLPGAGRPVIRVTLIVESSLGRFTLERVQGDRTASLSVFDFTDLVATCV
jgi:hypothetical protein